MRLIGVDPGKATGLVSFAIDENTQSAAPGCIDAYELDLIGVGNYFSNNLGSYKTVVVCEAFIITPQTAKNSPAPWSLETIGIVRYFCGKAGVPLFFVAPSSHKRLVNAGTLRRAGLYVKGGHARDAASVALYHVVTSLGLMQHVLKGGSDGAG